MFKKGFVAFILILFTESCFASSIDTLETAKQNIISLIQAGNLAEADTATNKLISDFNNTFGIDEAVHQIALKYQDAKNYPKVIEISRRVISNWPQSTHASWAQMDIVMANLSLGNKTSAQAEAETLMTNYRNDANLPRMLYIIGQGCKSQDYAETLKRHFDSNSPARIRLVISNTEILAKIELADYGAASQKVNTMIADFSSEPDLPDNLLFIAQHLVWWHQYETAGNIYQQIVNRYQNSAAASKAQQCLSKTGQVASTISAMISSGDYSRVTPTIQELISKFGDEWDTPSLIYDIAQKLEEAGQFSKAKETYEQIVWRYTNSAQFDMAKMGARRTTVLGFYDIGDENSANAAFDSMLQEFNGHSYLASNVMLTAEGYYRKAIKTQALNDNVIAKNFFNKSLNTLNLIINQFPNSDEIPNACFLAGDCCRRLGDYQKSIDYYQRLINSYPSDKRVCNALFLFGSTLQDMQNLNIVSGPQIDEQISSVYKRLIKDYPNCDELTPLYVPHAVRELSVFPIVYC